MPRRVPTALEKLSALEAKKEEILEQRKKELIRIFEKFNAFTIDDSLLTGFLLFATDPNSHDHPSLKEFRERNKTKGKRKTATTTRLKLPLFKKAKNKPL